MSPVCVCSSCCCCCVHVCVSPPIYGKKHASDWDHVWRHCICLGGACVSIMRLFIHMTAQIYVSVLYVCCVLMQRWLADPAKHSAVKFVPVTQRERCRGVPCRVLSVCFVSTAGPAFGSDFVCSGFDSRACVVRVAAVVKNCREGAVLCWPRQRCAHGWVGLHTQANKRQYILSTAALSRSILRLTQNPPTIPPTLWTAALLLRAFAWHQSNVVGDLLAASISSIGLAG